jgi:Protein of unknown function (DUF2975)
MTRLLSRLVAWACTLALVLVPLGAVYFLANIEALAALAQRSLGLNIQWQTVEPGQVYGLWLTTAVYSGVGLAGLFFLRRAFQKFANGELFNAANSRDLRRFSVLLAVQAIAQPLHLAISSIILSANHPAGQKMLTVSFGSNELKMIGLAIVFWVISDLLLEGATLQTENRQFV